MPWEAGEPDSTGLGGSPYLEASTDGSPLVDLYSGSASTAGRLSGRHLVSHLSWAGYHRMPAPLWPSGSLFFPIWAQVKGESRGPAQNPQP